MHSIPLTNNHFYGLFLIALYSLTDEDKVILMTRIFNPETEECEDTDILEYDHETDDLDLFLQKLDWI